MIWWKGSFWTIPILPAQISPIPLQLLMSQALAACAAVL